MEASFKDGLGVGEEEEALVGFVVHAEDVGLKLTLLVV